MSGNGEEGFFRGTELVRATILAAFLALGLPAAYMFLQQKSQPPPRPQTLDDVKPIPPRDNHPSFATVEDQEKIRLHENPAYLYLLEKVRGKTVEELGKDASRDVLFAHVYRNPDRYRGVPIHIEGTADFVGINQEIEFAKSGILYEVWIRTAESAPEHYCCVFENPPPKFPRGPLLSEDVTFDGYFFKVMAYQARDLAGEKGGPNLKPLRVQMRGVPLLVGRLTWKPQNEPKPSGILTGSYLWMFALIGTLLIYAIIRLIFQTRSFAGVVAAIPKTTPGSGPQDQITPEELSQWASKMAHEDQNREDRDRNEEDDPALDLRRPPKDADFA